MSEIQKLAERESIISHWLCGAMGACSCPGDSNGAHPDTAACWKMAKTILTSSMFNPAVCEELALAISPDLERLGDRTEPAQRTPIA